MDLSGAFGTTNVIPILLLTIECTAPLRRVGATERYINSCNNSTDDRALTFMFSPVPTPKAGKVTTKIRDSVETHSHNVKNVCWENGGRETQRTRHIHITHTKPFIVSACSCYIPRISSDRTRRGSLRRCAPGRRVCLRKHYNATISVKI